MHTDENLRPSVDTDFDTGVRALIVGAKMNELPGARTYPENPGRRELAVFDACLTALEADGYTIHLNQFMVLQDAGLKGDGHIFLSCRYTEEIVPWPVMYQVGLMLHEWGHGYLAWGSSRPYGAARDSLTDLEAYDKECIVEAAAFLALWHFGPVLFTAFQLREWTDDVERTISENSMVIWEISRHLIGRIEDCMDLSLMSDSPLP